MDDTTIVAVYVVLDDILRAVGHRSHPLAGVTDAEVLTVAVVAACRFQNHHERALGMMHALGYLSASLSISRFNRRAHALVAQLAFALDALAEVCAVGTAFVVDSLPIPACRYVRGGRCRKARGKGYVGQCAAKRARFFGWRLHLLVTPAGVPVAFRVPSGWHAARESARPHADLRPHGGVAHWMPGVRGQGVQQRERRGMA